MFIALFMLSTIHATPVARPAVSFVRADMHCTSRPLVQGSGTVRTCEATPKKLWH